VEKGDQKWEITDQQLDQLPDEIRPHVERFAGGDVLIRLPRIGEPVHLPNVLMMDKEAAMEQFRKPETREFFRKLAPFDIEQRLKGLDERLEQLQNELRQLRGGDDDSNDKEADEDSAEPEDNQL
jgi:hypothetical protein